MAAIEFDERDLNARVPDLAAGGAWTQVRLRWRRDPLTGASARILTGVKLQPGTRPDLTELTAKPAFCPFDREHLEKATVPFPAELTAEGRIRVGRAVREQRRVGEVPVVDVGPDLHSGESQLRDAALQLAQREVRRLQRQPAGAQEARGLLSRPFDRRVPLAPVGGAPIPRVFDKRLAELELDDVEGTVKQLKGKGVTFEHYNNLPGLKLDGDIHRAGPFSVAWFKDPAGNTLSVLQQSVIMKKHGAKIELFDNLVGQRLGAFGVVRPEVEVHEPPAFVVREPRAEPIDLVVRAVHANDRRAIRRGAGDLPFIGRRGHEHDRAKPVARRGRGPEDRRRRRR